MLIPLQIVNVQVTSREHVWFRFNDIQARVGMEAIGHTDYQVKKDTKQFMDYEQCSQLPMVLGS